MKLVQLIHIADPEGSGIGNTYVWINPEQVAGVLADGKDGTQLFMAGAVQASQVIHLDEPLDMVVHKLQGVTFG